MGIHLHHDHDHDHDPDHSHAGVSRALSGALIVTIVFMVVEFAAGWYSNSLALLSDAGHMLIDVGAILLSLFAWWISRRPSSASMSFGYQRAEILGALLSGLVIWLLAGVLVFEAVLRLHEPPAVQGKVVFITAAIGLMANLASMVMLHGRRDHSLNVRAAYLHMVADCLGSVGALIAGGVIWWTDWRLIDPLMTILFALLMLLSSWKLVAESVGVLMQATPANLDAHAIQAELAALDGVVEVHDLHIWTVSTGKLALSVHLVSTDAESVLLRANGLLQEKYSIVHTTVQVEHPERFQSERCYDCAYGSD